MASNGTGQRPGGSSFLKYMVDQGANRGLQQIDKALGTPMPNANAGAPPKETPAASSVAPPPTAGNPSMTMNKPEMTETQPPPLRLLDQDRYYRDMGRLPTAADLAASQFATRFRATEGRPPTRKEVMAHMYRRPDVLAQVSQDFEV
jgi:hypothetical protein